ncbi:hypothetical protein ASE21_12325 [Flavobacterium sp. Root901]|uniref:hypothetical protein n=1 Tax=Flavobacterium sp. Root901 TaxID=1736605 RepID=UPI00070B562F|nr:hypothetical protein [Flavobacterium sp. Root901]KRD10479.1 hypothetical protein ASE21_12325 [Flavobacterium sp. Root901]
MNAFYNYGTFLKLSKLVVLEDSSKFSHLLKKIDYVRIIEAKLFNKEAKMQIFAGIVFFLAGIGLGIFLWSVVGFGITILISIAFVLQGIILFLKGIGNYRQY